MNIRIETNPGERDADVQAEKMKHLSEAANAINAMAVGEGFMVVEIDCQFPHSTSPQVVFRLANPKDV